MRRLSTTFGLVAALGFLAPATPAAGTETESLQSARSTLEKWVETQQVLSKEKKDWQVGKEMLRQRIDLLDDEIASLEKRSAETEKAIEEAEGKKRDLVKEARDLDAAFSSLESVIASLEGKTRKLLVALPGPLRDKVGPLAQRIPENPATTKATLGERFQNVVGILNEVQKFDRDVTVATEIRKLPDGTSAEVTSLYLGLGQGYYVSPKGDIAGVGRPSDQGWSWTPANDLAPRIAEAIAVVRNDQVPTFVPLPVEIR